MRRMTAMTVLGLVLLLTGCGIVPGVGPDPRPDAVPVSTMTCPATSADSSATAGRVPAGFEAVVVVRCDPYASRQDNEGLWAGALLERLEGDLGPVLAALAQPSDPRSLGPCTTIGYILPELWLQDATGQFVRVAVPASGCGEPKEVGLDAALAALSVAQESFTPAALVESAAATAAGCASQAGMLIIAGLDGENGLATEPSVPEEGIIGETGLVPYELPSWPDLPAVTGARLCDYAAPAAAHTMTAIAPVDSTFVGARELAGAEAQAIIAEAQRAPAAAACVEDATLLVVVHPMLRSGDAAPFTVELDGCGRLVDPGFQARAASAGLLELLAPAD